MISSAIVQSAIVLMNRRMKAERDVRMFVPVCSSVTGMHLHHSQGTNYAQAQTCRLLAQYDSTATDGTRFARHGVGSPQRTSIPWISSNTPDLARATAKFPSELCRARN